MVAGSAVLLKVGPTLKLEQVAPSLFQLCFEDLQRWDFLCFSWQPVPMSDHSQCFFFFLFFFLCPLPLSLNQNFHFPSYQSGRQQVDFLIPLFTRLNTQLLQLHFLPKMLQPLTNLVASATPNPVYPCLSFTGEPRAGHSIQMWAKFRIVISISSATSYCLLLWISQAQNV